MKRVHLCGIHKDLYALVDDEDYEKVKDCKWKLSKGYAVTWTNRVKPIAMHRLIMDTPDGMETDHKNLNRLDNRRGNLTNCTRSENMRNRVKFRQSYSSKYKGVSWVGRVKKWQAQINFDGQQYYLGLYENEEDAARTYDKKAKELFGEFANLNFPS